VDPDAGLHVTSTDVSTVSLPDAVNVTTSPAGLFAGTVLSAGTDTVGGFVSTTVTSKLPVSLLPASSDAVQVTVVDPREKVEPDEGSQDGVTVGSMSSVADTSKVTSAPAGDMASTVIGPGTVTTGGVVSCGGS
jgi:hypothetical protein